MRTLTYPFDEKQVRALKAGDAVSITGRVYTGRDKFHKRFADGGKLPVDFKDGALYHCGPVVVSERKKEKGKGADHSNLQPSTFNPQPLIASSRPGRRRPCARIRTSRASSRRAACASSSARAGWTRRRWRR